MAYGNQSTEGAAADPVELLTRIEDFAVANGWERHLSTVTDGDGNRHVFLTDEAVGGEVFANMTAVGATGIDSRLFLFPSFGSDVTKATYAQPNRSGGTPPFTSGNPGSPDWDALGNFDLQVPDIDGAIVSYHLFTDGVGSTPGPRVRPTYLYACIEVSANQWRHILFGVMEKYGTWSNGAFYCLPNLQVSASAGNDRQDPSGNRGVAQMFDGISSISASGAGPGTDTARKAMIYAPGVGLHDWLVNGPAAIQSAQNSSASPVGVNGLDDGSGTNIASTVSRDSGLKFNGRGGLYDSLMSLGPSAVNLQSPTFPIYAWHPDATGRDRMLGKVPNFRMCNVSVLTPGEQINVGGTFYRTFPIASKVREGDATTGPPWSGDYGFAIAEV